MQCPKCKSKRVYRHQVPLSAPARYQCYDCKMTGYEEKFTDEKRAAK